MFYLLEDNRIIDSEELKRKLHFDAKVGIIDNELIVTLENFPIFRSESKIKKQSENVYEFIDKSLDLVKVDGQIMMAKHINGDITKMSSISAIYKPDAQGNYIKVWEEKEDE